MTQETAKIPLTFTSRVIGFAVNLRLVDARTASDGGNMRYDEAGSILSRF